MAAATILAVDQQWAGDRKRHRVALTLASTNADTVTPESVGLKFIESVKSVGLRTGTIPVRGVSVTLTDIGTGPTVAWATASVTITVQTAGTCILNFYGW